jgi:hypothetical protein
MNENCMECARRYLGTCVPCGESKSKCFLEKSDWMTDEINLNGLRPCPFCGGEAILKSAIDKGWVVCDNCKSRTLMEIGFVEARNRWNQRAYDFKSEQ